MSNYIDKCLVVGTSEIAREYSKVLKELKIKPIVVGRKYEKAEKFGNENEVSCYGGGIELFLNKTSDVYSYAIVAVDVLSLCEVTSVLLEAGIKNILIEKPAGMNKEEINIIVQKTYENNANVYVGYNRRFYTSTDKVLEYIEKDGGVKSFNFEFTEWSHTIEPLDTDARIKEAWFLANSTHVVDLAFFLGGEPKNISCYTFGSLKWHKDGCIYAGAGISQKNALFSYQANWAAPGRWAIEILTNKHRLYLKPMEKLSVQEIGSVHIIPLELNDDIDLKFKPGFYKEVESFIYGIDDGKKKTIYDQLRYMEYYEKIEGIEHV